jgi:hypothetical protein
VQFEAHVELLRLFLAHREQLIGRIEGLLNAQRKPPQYLQNVSLLSRHFEDCFFTLPQLSREQTTLRRELDEAHWASGFKPRATLEHRQELIDAGEMMSRAFILWQRFRWPGHDGRVRYAQTLFNVYILRRLMLLAMRLWDAGAPSPRLAQLQAVLDELWRSMPVEQPVFVRDARWLIPLAQSPTTDELHGYFVVAEQVAETLPEQDRLAICDASVRMAGGHLRSQLRHVATQRGVSIDDRALVLSTRRSNALDVATLTQALVPLLTAYERGVIDGNSDARLELADAICQGISPDPELFLSRLDLLAPYSMIEHLFIATDRDGHVGYTPMGQRHLRLLKEYAALIGRVARPLHEDCARFRPLDGTYSPYGALFGYSSQLLEHMTLKATQPDAVARFGIEDVFVAGDADKRAWVNGWRKLPHVPREVAKLFEYPQRFAEQMFERVEDALRRCVEDLDANNAAIRNGRLFVLPADGAQVDPQTSAIPDLPSQYIVSTSRPLVAERKALLYDEAQLLHSRAEGEFLVSYATAGGWVAITKDILTDIVGAGRDAKIPGLTRDAARVLQLMCPELALVL